jgi:hypothetical protein
MPVVFLLPRAPSGRAAVMSSLASLLLSGACTSSAERNESGLRSDSSDTSDSSLTGDCVVDDDVFPSVEQHLAEVATVGVVDWTTSLEGGNFVRFVDANGTLQTVPAGNFAKAHALLLGFEQNTEYSYQLLLESPSGETWCSSPRALTTGTLPLELPQLHAKVSGSAESFGGFIITTVATDLIAFPAILDANGQYVWAAKRSLAYQPGVSIIRTTATADRSAIVFVEGNPVAPFIGKFFSLSLDGSLSSSFTWPAGIDFQILPDGTYAILTRNEKDFVNPEGEDQSWRGDALIEFDPKSGVSVPIWDVFTEFSPSDPRYARAADPMGDWAHVNSLSYDVADDAYFVTAENPEAVMRIRRADGVMSWLIDSNVDSTIPNNLAFADGADSEEILHRPHSAQFLGHSLLVFNRSTLADPENCARTSEITIDEELSQVDLAWTWKTDACIYNDFMGEAERLPNGNTQVIWSAVGRIDEVTPTGEDVFRVEVDAGMHIGLFGFGERTDSLYPGGRWSGRSGIRP